MESETQEQIRADLEQLYYCPGAKECGITGCQHFEPHGSTDGCSNECIGTSGCIPLVDERETR